MAKTKEQVWEELEMSAKGLPRTLEVSFYWGWCSALDQCLAVFENTSNIPNTKEYASIKQLLLLMSMEFRLLRGDVSRDELFEDTIQKIIDLRKSGV